MKVSQQLVGAAILNYNDMLIRSMQSYKDA